MKICTKCKETKEYKEFSKDKQKKDGHSSQCRLCKSAYEKSYLANNKNKIYARNTAYNKLHKEAKRQYDSVRREANRVSINAKKRAYYHSAGKFVEAIWREANQHKVTIYARNSRYRRRSLENSTNLSSQELLLWSFNQTRVCTYCGTTCADNYHIDHIEPLSKGGSNSIDNLTISCPSCNQSKGNKQLLHWLAIQYKSRNL